MSGSKKDSIAAFRVARDSITSQWSAMKKQNHAQKRTNKKRGGRFWLNVATFVLIAVILILARDQLVEAWHLVGHTNLWILSLLIPVQFLSFYASTEIFFTYLRARGQLKQTSALQATGMSLELNFVNHVFPSGGVSGMSYMVWRLGKLGVSAGQSTMAQIMRFTMQMSTFLALMVVALIWATAENRTASWVVVSAAIGITSLVFLVIFGSYLIKSRERMESFASFLTHNINRLVKKITFGKKPKVLAADRVERFFIDFHEDFMVLRADKRLLQKPIIWSFVFNISEILLFMVAFWALGSFVNPAVLLIAYGAATLAGVFMFTPGGAGAYEAIMIGILTASGVNGGVAFAGVILARVILLLGTLVSGFVVYQRALAKYGRPDLDEKVDLTPDQEIERVEKAGRSESEIKKKQSKEGAQID